MKKIKTGSGPRFSIPKLPEATPVNKMPTVKDNDIKLVIAKNTIQKLIKLGIITEAEAEFLHNNNPELYLPDNNK